MVDELIKKFENYKFYINGWENMKRASVAILLYEENEEIYIVFEVRSKTLRSQPGDISFPGGKIDENEDEKTAIIREICEELGLNKGEFEIKHKLSLLITHYGLLVHPFIGYIKNINSLNINKDEVDKILLVPLKHLINNNPLEVKSKLVVDRNNEFPYDLINSGKNYKFKQGNYRSLFYEYEGNIIWGMTALILEDFLNFIKY